MAKGVSSSTLTITFPERKRSTSSEEAGEKPKETPTARR
jgi:hypothetical protein